MTEFNIQLDIQQVTYKTCLSAQSTALARINRLLNR